MARDDNNNNESDVERLIDAFSSAKSWYEDNQDLFNGVGAVANRVDMTAPEPLSEAHIKEDEVRVVAEVRESGVNQIGVSFNDGIMVCEVADRQLEVDVPRDVDEDSLEATMSNGVLEVTVQRTIDTDNSVDVIMEDDTDDTVDELFDDDEDNGGDDDGTDE